MKMPLVTLFLALYTTRCYALHFNMTIFYRSHIFNYMFGKYEEGINASFLDSFSPLTNARNKFKEGKSAPVVFLNPGNTVQRNLVRPFAWYMHMMNSLKPTATGLSSFVSAPTIYTMAEYFKLAKFPILACNVSPKDPVMSKKIEPSTIVAFNDTKVGIIGYISQKNIDFLPTDVNLASSDQNTIEALWAECTRLQELGVPIIIGIGYSDLMTDLRIAEAVECLDIVIGSDFEIFSWFDTPLVEFRDVRKPVIVQNYYGKKIPVLQSYDTTLGELSVRFNDQGHLISIGHDNNISDLNVNYKTLEYVPSSSDNIQSACLYLGLTTWVVCNV